jgi:hypothetical protein
MNALFPGSPRVGIGLNFAELYVGLAARYDLSGRLLALGRQDVGLGPEALIEMARHHGVSLDAVDELERPLTQESFFRALGFAVVESLDVSDHEDAEHVFDLNRPPADLPESLRSSFDVVLNGGTLEHVFHVVNAMRSSLAMLGDGGVFLHVAPMNNYVDHGFYQISPTWLFDFATANHWEVLESVSICSRLEGRRVRSCEIRPLPPGTFGSYGELDDSPYMHFAAIRRRHDSTLDVIPKQSVYSARQGDPVEEVPRPRSFDAYVVEGGVPVRLAPGHHERRKRSPLSKLLRRRLR